MELNKDKGYYLAGKDKNGNYVRSSVPPNLGKPKNPIDTKKGGCYTRVESPVFPNLGKLKTPLHTDKELAKAAKVSHDAIYKAEKAKERQAIGHLNAPQYKNGRVESPVIQNSGELKTPIETKVELAKVAQVSHNTIQRVEYIQKHAPEEIKEQAKVGSMSINEAYKQAINRFSL